MANAVNPSGTLLSRLHLGPPGGPALLGLNILLAVVVFKEGFEELFRAWQLAEYSHGPLIPVLSGLLFLRQLKTVPLREGPINDRWPGVAVTVLAIAIALLGKFSQIPDLVAYSIIVWVAGILLISFGFRQGVQFWAAVLHLVFMLPLPGILYWKVSIFLRGIASEFGVYLVQLANVPVYLDGNIIDLGVYKLHVADACSGLRYLFPIMSFSYIFATLYRGPTWHKAVLLLSAAPITVFMNSVRIGIVGVMVDSYGIDWAIGISHWMEGWVIFVTCIFILFGLAKVMLMLQRQKMSLAEALDLDVRGIRPQLGRVMNIKASRAFVASTAVLATVAAAWVVIPKRGEVEIDRLSLVLFPAEVGDWTRASFDRLDPAVEQGLGADDYLAANYVSPGAPLPVEIFIAWYADQTRGGIHSPEVCLPAGGWEIAELSRPNLAPALGVEGDFEVNRAVIEKGGDRQLVYYWFEQVGDRTANDLVAKFNLLRDSVLLGRSDGALVRLATPMMRGETVAEADARLMSMLKPSMAVMGNYVPRIE